MLHHCAKSAKKNRAVVEATATPELLTDEQAAAFLSVEPRTLRLWRNTQGLPFIRVTSKIIRYRKVDLDGWLARRRVAIAA